MKRELAALAMVAAALLAWQALIAPPRLPPEAIRRLVRERPGPPLPDVIAFAAPAPEGRTVMARFYGLARLPAGDDAVICADMRRTLAAVAHREPATEDGMADDLAKVAREKTDAACDGETPRAAGAALARLLAEPVDLQRILDRGRERPQAFDAALARLIVAWLREARDHEEVAAAVGLGSHIGDFDGDLAGVHLHRFTTDLDRIAGLSCGAELRVMCHAVRLVRVGEAYARIGRLTNDEQHFKDMAEVLAIAEPDVLRLPERRLALSLMEDIVAAYGNAGEAGRDPALLRRAVDMAEAILAEVKPADGAPGDFAYGEALETLAIALGRYAAHAPDRIGATRRATEVGEEAIAHRSVVLPDSPSWASHVNLASEQRDLFELTLDPEWIGKAEANARRALALKAVALGESAPDADHFYARMRLGQVLVWRAKHAPDIDDARRQDMFEEARGHLDVAEALFRSLNTQAYLRIIARARPLLPARDAPPR